MSGVIASEAKQSTLSLLGMDCVASLAMTKKLFPYLAPLFEN
jgi:hypothetical protein